jgi:uncharacterized membrane protein YfcA
MTLLVLAVLLASTISGAIGMGGGVLLLGIMASLLAPEKVVPLHGVVQLVGNFTRTLRLLRHVAWGLVLLYIPTLLLGVWVALRIYAGGRLTWFRPVIGLFILIFLAWERFRPRRVSLPRWAFAPGGFVGGMLTILVGASGPYLAVFFLRDDMERREIVATKATIQTVGHLVKIPAFLSVGFPYHSYVGLLVPLVAAAILGTLLGTWALRLMGERAFRILFRVVLGLLALRLLAQAVL